MRIPWGALLAIFTVAFAGVFVMWLRSREHGALYDVPKFALIDQDGRRVTDTDLRGHVWVVDFVFTRCSATCPTLLSRFYEIARDYPRDVKLVSITVDPDRDTPAVMKEFASRVDADFSRWSWLTGEKATLYKLMGPEGFKVGEPGVPTATDIPHTPYILLVDARGRVRGVYDGTDREAYEKRLRPELQALYDAEKRIKHVRKLPTVNATLNGASGLLLLLGYVFIRSRRIGAHRACMIAACLTSLAFLASYLTYHHFVGSVRFTGEGWIRPVYYSVLVSHTVLAALIVPLVLVTLARALGGRFERHRAIARWTFPLWLYVSVTGVVVYFMLYVFYPGR